MFRVQYSPPLFLFRCLRGSGSERRCSHPAFCHQRGSDQSDYHGSDGLAAADGDTLHHWSLFVRRSHPREVLPRKVRHLGGCNFKVDAVILYLLPFVKPKTLTDWLYLSLFFIVPLSPVVPHLGGCRGIRSFPRSLQLAGVSLHGGSGLRWRRHSLTRMHTHWLTHSLTHILQGGTGSNNMHRVTHTCSLNRHTHALHPKLKAEAACPVCVCVRNTQDGLPGGAIKTDWQGFLFSFCPSVCLSICLSIPTSCGSFAPIMNPI